MKVVVEIDPEGSEEIRIRVREITPQLQKLQNVLQDALSSSGEIAVKSADGESFLDPREILFAETAGGAVMVHTAREAFSCPLRLYELEAILPHFFVRASKSSLINTARIRALSRGATGLGEAGFSGSEKKVLISRMYFKIVRDVIEETRLKK